MSEKINPEQLKEAMRAWITGVAIVSGCHAGICHGMTANSFNSLALSPPTVLVALQQVTRTEHLVHASGAFGVTILNTNQADLAKRFAGELGEEQPRFQGVETFTLVSGAPLIKGGLAFFDCQVVKSLAIGASTVFLGEVLATQKHDGEGAPLLYYNRNWRKLAEE